MMKVTGSGQILGATIDGLDLAQPLSDEQFALVLRSLGDHGVVRFPSQRLSAQHLKNFSACFGNLEINVANAYQEPGIPEVMILSNILEHGKPIGLSDAGKDWQTELSYTKSIRFAKAVHGGKNPLPEGQH